MCIYSKPIIDFHSKPKIKFTISFENTYDPQETEKLLLRLERCEIQDFPKNYVTKIVFENMAVITELTKQYHYDMKALLEYVFGYLKPFENIEPSDAFRELCDYYSMATDIGRTVKKYPTYLRSMHDIISANHKAFKQTYDEPLFLEQVRKHDVTFANKEFCVVPPQSSKCIIREGMELNHCVGSYIPRIIKGDVMICFLRKKQAPEEGLVTLEISNNRVVQAAGAYNRKLTEEERKFLEKFCKTKKIQLSA